MGNCPSVYPLIIPYRRGHGKLLLLRSLWRLHGMQIQGDPRPLLICVDRVYSPAIVLNQPDI
jgi:hypothetical protein